LVELDSGFDNPVLLVAAPDGGTDLIVEQSGAIVRTDADHSVVVDISGDVRFEGEQGLLGLAIHPNFDENNLVYVNYTNNSGDTVIEQLSLVDGDIDLASRTTILTIDQPAGNHNGGMIAFGPDGYLWIAMGDGGASNDRFGNGQNPDSLLGSMLRIEVGAPGVVPFGIPPDNPFADGVGGRPEVWAIGLRNPWRFDFDGETVWIADVGQERLEEVNAVPTSEPGLNYGWSIMEGSACFRANECATDGLVVPIAEYAHPDGCSITGGVVYRGDAVPSLRGQYFFSDFCSGILRSVSIDGVGRDWTDMIGPIGGATGFGVGGDGEMYVVTKQGSLFRLEGAGNG
jgi:glucose/arabinose dehydrogenase